jgi:hypothetical protein
VQRPEPIPFDLLLQGSHGEPSVFWNRPELAVNLAGGKRSSPIA